jgi:hypothetical protein
VVEVVLVLEREGLRLVQVFEGEDMLGQGKVNRNNGDRRLGTDRGCG